MRRNHVQTGHMVASSAIGADRVKLPMSGKVRDSHDDLTASRTHPAPNTPGYRVTGSARLGWPESPSGPGAARS